MRRRAFLAGVAGAATTGLAGCGSSTDDDSGTVVPALRGTPTPPADVTWTASFDEVAWLRVVDGSPFVATPGELGDRVTALRADDGTVRWRATVPGRSRLRRLGELLVADARRSADSQFLVALDPADGGRRWQRRGVTGVVGLVDGTLVAVQPETGQGVGFAGLEPATGNPRWATSGVGRYGGATDGRLVYAATGSPTRVVVRDAATGGAVWRRELSALTGGTPTPVGDSVVTVAGRRAVGLRADDGERAFAETLPGSGGSIGVADATRVYTGDWQTGDERRAPGYLVALALGDGLAWTREVGRLAAPFAVGESLYTALATDSGRAVAAFDPTDGTTRWQRAGDPVGVDRHGVYLVRDGVLHALTEAGERRWRVSLPTDRATRFLPPFDSPAGTTLRFGDDRVVVASETGVASYDAADGSRRARVDGVGELTALAVGTRLAVLGVENRLLGVRL